MLYWLINKGMENAFSAGWKTVAGTGRGLRGTTSYVDEAGEEVFLSPARKLARTLKNDAKQMATGKRYDIKNELIEEAGDVSLAANRLSGFGNLIGDSIFGTLGTGLGWGVRKTATTAANTVKAAARPTAQAVGHLTRQTIDETVGFAADAAGAITALNKTRGGREVLFGAGAVGTIGIGGVGALKSQWGSDALGDQALQFYSGSPIDSLPGTVTPSEVGADYMPASEAGGVRQTGADGDLVLALHNLR